MKLELSDLQPKESVFKLGEETFTLKKFSLAAQVWTQQRFGSENIEGIFANMRIGEISEIAYHLVKDKSKCPTLESFQEMVCTHQDKMSLIQSMLDTIGLSQPIIEKLARENPQGNEKSLSQPTGAKSSTSSDVSMDGASASS